MNTRYFDLTESQKLDISNDDLATAIRIEAVNRGIKPPLQLDEETIKTEWTGFQTLPNSVVFYEIQSPTQWGSTKATGIMFKTEAEAWAACQNAFGVEHEEYGERKTEIRTGEFRVQAVNISSVKPKTVTAKIEDYFQDDAEFDKLAKECVDDLSMIRQSDYDKKVLTNKRKSYMALAQGNEEIARAFWEKTEGGEFPADQREEQQAA
jgi:hypothetical protein